MNYTIAFYNLENLFDFRNDAKTFDEDFLPNSQKRWDKKRYFKKIEKLGRVISMIGSASEGLSAEEQENPPAIIGLAEVENKRVLHDLTQSTHLKQFNYRYIHFDSKDERGVDVALLYDPERFTEENTKTFDFYLEKENGRQDYTRDILLVSGKLNDEYVHILVNHWPSRREGQQESEVKRMTAAKKAIEIIEGIKTQKSNAKFIVMGDFNDNPNNEPMCFLSETTNLHNPMATMRSYSKGSVNHNFTWNMFDQILVSTTFFHSENNKLKYESAHIYDAPFLKQAKGRYKGQPSRTYAGDNYLGGFSDHFPVYLLLST